MNGAATAWKPGAKTAPDPEPGKESDHAARPLPSEHATQEAAHSRVVRLEPDDGSGARCDRAASQGDRPPARHSLSGGLQHQRQDDLYRPPHAEDRKSVV